VLACSWALAAAPIASSGMARAARRPRCLRIRQRDRPGSCSSANVQPQRERAATAKRTAARVNEHFQGRRRYVSMASRRTNQPVISPHEHTFVSTGLSLSGLI
jgi:hypothetical protein